MDSFCDGVDFRTCPHYMQYCDFLVDEFLVRRHDQVQYKKYNKELDCLLGHMKFTKGKLSCEKMNTCRFDIVIWKEKKDRTMP